MKLTVTINGTDTNSWHRLGFRQNPFPQIPKAELAPAMHQLALLDGDPIKSTDDIRRILKGWSQEFIDLCCQNFIAGQRVRFTVALPETGGV